MESHSLTQYCHEQQFTTVAKKKGVQSSSPATPNVRLRHLGSQKGFGERPTGAQRGMERKTLSFTWRGKMNVIDQGTDKG